MKYGLALDIDETLSRTNISWMTALSKACGNPENLTPEELVAKYRYTQNVPYWQTDEANTLMHEMLHANDYQVEIDLIKNANHVVNEIDKLIPIVAYITARPSSVIDGTKRWLKKHGFPDATIITRPDNVSIDERSVWKAKVLHEMYPHVLGIVDDHAELASHLPENYQGTLFLYDATDHERNSINIIPCKTWDDVRSAVNHLHQTIRK